MKEGSAQPVDDPAAQELTRRSVSALVLAPIALAAVYFGSPYLETLLTMAAVVMAWEWDRLCGEQRFAASGYVMAATFVLAGVGGGAGWHGTAVIVLAVGCVAVYAIAKALGRPHAGWIAAGVLAIGLPCAAVVWLRADPEKGLAIVFWLVGTVWATDMGAYAVGRSVGGVRLAPTISPGKTWAGLGGGVAGAGVWGLVWALWVGASMPWVPALLGAVGALVAQAGDLSVSFVKRRFGVKDASNLIPGHGGVLDRFDGMLTLAPILAVLVKITEGNIL